MAEYPKAPEVDFDPEFREHDLYCNSDCGCAGGQPAATCDFEPGCIRCFPAQEKRLIENAELEIESAQYRALHDRLEDFTTWMIATGYLAKKAIGDPVPGERSSFDEYLFEFIESYLDGVIEHEDRHPVQQILKPDLDEESVDSAGRERPQF